MIHVTSKSKPMRKTRAVALGVSLMLLMPMCASAGQQTGKVIELIVRASDGLHYFSLDGASTGKPACATKSYWMIKDEGSVAATSQMSIILSAMAQDKPIKVVGSGTCTRWGDGEDVDYIRVN